VLVESPLLVVPCVSCWVSKGAMEEFEVLSAVLEVSEALIA